MYIDDKNKFFLESYFTGHGFLTSKEFSTLQESGDMSYFNSLIQKLLKSLSSIIDSTKKEGDKIADCKGNIKEWVEFKKLDDTLMALNLARKQYAKIHPFYPFLDNLLNIEAFLLDAEITRLFKQSFMEQNESVKIVFHQYVETLYIGVMHILSHQTVMSVDDMGLLCIYFNIDKTDKLTLDLSNILDKMSNDVKSNKTRDFLKTSIKNNSILNEVLDPFSLWASASIITFIGSMLMARHMVRYYYRIKKKTANYLDLQAKFLDISASRSNSAKVRDKQIKIADDFRALANKVKIEQDSAMRLANDDVRQENPEFKDLTNPEYNAFTLM
jgi:hypothetical protein